MRRWLAALMLVIVVAAVAFQVGGADRVSINSGRVVADGVLPPHAPPTDAPVAGGA